MHESDMKTLSSPFLRLAGYNAISKRLYIQMRRREDSLYVYHSVPHQIFHDFINSDNHSKYFSNAIKPVFTNVSTTSFKDGVSGDHENFPNTEIPTGETLKEYIALRKLVEKKGLLDVSRETNLSVREIERQIKLLEHVKKVIKGGRLE